MCIEDKEIIISGRLIKIAEVATEWYYKIDDIESLIEKFKKSNYQADIFSFFQSPAETEPKYNKYHMEWQEIASMPIESFDVWWNQKIQKHVRKKVKKAEKKGVVVKLVNFNDEFVKGITNIFNESPIRQGKPFWHYGKDFDTVKKEVSTYLERCDFIGAYFDDRLIGFIKVFYDEDCASTMQVISMIQHRDKAPTNALISKLVEVCAEKNVSCLTYGVWSEGTLGDFKKYNGFQKMTIPKYYIPLTAKGKIVLNLNLHHGIKGMLPDRIRRFLINLRTTWYSRQKDNSR